MVGKGAVRLDRLVGKLLDMARLESGVYIDIAHKIKNSLLYKK